jgi:hypothetical protein
MKGTTPHCTYWGSWRALFIEELRGGGGYCIAIHTPTIFVVEFINES